VTKFTAVTPAKANTIMTSDKISMMLHATTVESELRMQQAQSRDEFIFSSGLYSASAFLFLTMVKDTPVETAQLAIVNKIKDTSFKKYGNQN